MKKLIIQFFKFGIVGVINTVSSWIVYYSLLFVNIQYLVATTIAYFTSSIIGYFLNKIWVFKKNKEKKDNSSIVRYYIVYISSYFLNLGCMYLLVDILGISDKIAPILVLFVTVPYNFIFSKLWIFKQKKQNKDVNVLKEIAKEKHTFAICAYKESQYLEECIKSVKNQSTPSNYLIATSTDCEYIKNLAIKYDIEYIVKDGESDIQDDWEFAYNSAKTELVTIAHQDDVYSEKYLEKILDNYDINGNMYIVDYNPFKNGKVVEDKNSKIKEILKICLRSKVLSNIKFFKVSSLALGNSINCPSVVYNKSRLKDDVFKSELKFALDWDIFQNIARKPGRMVYVNERLINYRIHDEATTKQFIVDNRRLTEDTIMFNKFWPKWITKLIMKFYVKSYDIY